MSEPHFGVAIGINDYPGFGPAAQLKVAKQDAARFAAWLRSRELPAGQVHLLRSVSAQNPLMAVPTADIVDGALASFVAALEKLKDDAPGLQGHRLLNGSRLYLFFSGHGVTTQDAELAMMMANASDLLTGLNITAELYVQHFKRRGLFRRVILFADCCRTLSPQTRGRGPSLSDPGVSADDVKTQIYFAAPYNTRAYEGSTHGHFSRSLLEGLLGAAADPVTGKVTNSTLLEWLKVRLPQLSRGVQEAQWRGDDTDDELAAADEVLDPKGEDVKFEDYVVAMNSYLGVVDLPSADPDADIEKPDVQNALLDDLRRSVKDARTKALDQFRKSATNGNNRFLGAEAPKNCRVRIVFPDAFQGMAEIVDGDGTVAVQWNAAFGPLSIPLPAGFYEVRPVGGAGFVNALFALDREDIGDVRLAAN